MGTKSLNRLSKWFAPVFAVMLLAGACGSDGTTAPTPTTVSKVATTAAPAADVSGLTIGMVLMAQNTGFFNTAACGAVLAASELGLTLNVDGPPDFDAVMQVAVLEAVTARGPDAILIAPHDRTVLVGPMREAKEAGIVIAEFDAVVDDASISVSRLQTDNAEGGRIGARALAELIGDEGKVLLVDYKRGTQSTDARADGFEEAIATFSNIEYLGVQYAENDPAKAAEIIGAIVSANPDLAGVFVTTGAGSDGVATALREQGLRPGVKLIGFDADPAHVEQLRNGFVDAIVTQQPFQMGYKGVYELVNALTGQSVTALHDTGTIVVTSENVDAPETQGGQYRLGCDG